MSDTEKEPALESAEAEDKQLEEASVTMLDVLEQEKELDEEYAAVLGASDEKSCTYAKGAIKRQALYSCLTCCPEARNDLSKCVGICLACSYRCHENHDLVELYTKRNFRCDCPTVRMGEKYCALNPQLSSKQPLNETNAYNHNFQGLYCNCKRPYPDPDRTTEEAMLQCAICEDWYHLAHLKAPAAAAKLLDICSEMICDTCMERHDFLHDYTGLAMKALEDLDESAANITVTGDVSLCEEKDVKLKSELDKSISDIMNINERDDGDVTAGADNESVEEAEGAGATKTQLEATEPPSKRYKPDDEQSEPVTELKSNTCRRPSVKREKENVATFWGNDWRNAFCKCVECIKMYEAQNVEFLIDAEDSTKLYEERGMKRAAENSTYEQGIRALASIGRTQQIDAITEYNRMMDKLKEYLQSFAASKKVVTEEDINRFFEGMRNENNANLGQPYFCR